MSGRIKYYWQMKKGIPITFILYVRPTTVPHHLTFDKRF